MGNPTIERIRKRDGNVVDFRPEKIEAAIGKALAATGTGDGRIAASLAGRAIETLEKAFVGAVPTVEDIQDVVEQTLMSGGYALAAKAYILYRQQRAEVRHYKRLIGVRDDLKLGVNAIKVLERRYLLKDEEGRVVETPREMFRRVAHAIAIVETGFEPGADTSALEEEFFNSMINGEFLPNSPTLMNAGAPLGQLSACFVLPVEDSIPDIFDALKNAAIVHQSGGGTGFTFGHLRPEGDIVGSTKGVASGPVSFMRIFDVATGVMKQGGKRRGANMGILPAGHPDISQFVAAKKDERAFSHFNLSVAATDEFMEAVRREDRWPLVNPRTGREAQFINAHELLDLMVNNAWHTGDPGLVFLDQINRSNPTPQLGTMEATNPCGELPLLPYESCNLGSINLSTTVSGGKVDWPKLERLVGMAVRFLDNVVQANRFPLEAIARITMGNRKIGLGVMGFADALIKLGIPYDSEEALETAESVMRFVSMEAHRASSKLAAKRGPFPNYRGSRYDRPESAPLRNASLLSIAPTGTLSIIAGCSSGIEPLFALAFARNVMEGTRLLETNPLFEQAARERGFYSEGLMEEVARKGTLAGVGGAPEDIRRLFVTDHDISPEWHVRMQAVFQKHTDNAVSKTVNLPVRASPEDIRRTYLLAHELGCKGITVYRYGSKREQVLYLGSRAPGEAEAAYVTADSEYAGGCIGGSCPI